MLAGALPQTTLGEHRLQHSSRSASWFQGATSRQEGNGGEVREGLGGGLEEERGREGKGGWGRTEKGRSWGDGAMVVGG